MNGTVRVVASVPEAFTALVAESVGASEADRFSLFLSGGDLAAACYRDLAAATGPDASEEGRLDWSAVDLYLGDERCVPPDDPDSNHRMITEALLDRVGPVGSDHPMYRSGTPEDAARAYQAEVEALGSLDLVHLGLGPDGHCASLFPDSPALAIDDAGCLVAANHDPNGNNPHDRVTLTLPAIARARLVVFTVVGASKRPAFERIVNGEALPAARVGAHEIIWLVDAEAAGGATV